MKEQDQATSSSHQLKIVDLSSMSHQLPRPIFTKSRTTKRSRSSTGAGRGGGGRGAARPSRTPGRFHGAFEGGFSAGHFNTVGSRDGWKPTNEDDVEGADGALDVDQYDEFGRSVLRAGDAVDTSEPPKQQTGMGASAEISNINGKKRPRVWDRDRSAADYMDDRDYEDWGGPTGVSAEYADPNALSLSRGARKKSDENDDESGSGQQKGLGLLVPTELLQPVAGPTDAIGRLLLRKLGWREGSGTDAKSSAYVPTHDSGENIDTSNKSTACSHEALLSKRRLKRIQLSERGHSLPPPKIDSYGLGYDPFRNAPEFAAHREMRRKRAEEKARAAGAGGGQGRYHTSDLLDDDDTGGDDGVVDAFSTKKGSERSRNKSNVLAYETAEDFVGRTGTAGFALEDDDDDVYDSAHVASSAGISAGDGGSGRSKIVGIGGEEYHTELIDHDSDAEGESLSQMRHGGSGAFAGALSSWATGRETSAAGDPSTATRAVTSDGRLPLDGYVLGGSGGEQDITNERFQGPDLPPNFEPVRHVFREEDLPARVAEQSRKTKREAEEARSSKAGGGASSHGPINPPRREDVTPMAGAAFAGLAVAMKNRFTSAADKKGTEKTDDNIGLRTPSAIGGDALGAQSSNTEEKKDIEVRRSTILWAPDPLLCKRLGVRPPSRSTTPVSNQQKQTEETYFHKEILRTAGASATTNTSGSNGSRAVNANDGENNDVPIRPPRTEDDIGASRPPMDLFRSIFGAQSSDSDDSSSSDEEGVNGETKSALIGSVEEAAVEKGPFTASAGINGEKNGSTSIASTTHKEIDTGRSTDYITEKEKPHKHRRRRRSASLTSTSSSSSISSTSYERRKRKKKSKRRKKESSSRRREDDRKRSKDERNSKRKKRRNRSRSRSRSRDRERDIDRKTSKKSTRSRSKGGQHA